MKAATAEQMRNIDRYSIEIIGIPGIVLMENAALKVLKHINIQDNSSFTIVCGTGNNGGDGLAIARHLFALDKQIDVFVIGTLSKMSKLCRINYDILIKMGVKIYNIKDNKEIDHLIDSISKSQITVDALFGTGLAGDVKGIYYTAIESILRYSSYVIAVDIPSGLHCNTGEPLNICIKADKTVTFQLNKKGFLNPKSKEYTGKVEVESIGIPSFVVEKFI
jgi:NAD(P)H-hydrate epimerase